MAQLGETIHDFIHPILMIAQYGLFPLQSLFVYFVHQFNDVEVMYLEFGVQESEPFHVGLNPHGVALHDFRLVF